MKLQLKSNSEGFTLIEVLMIFVILGVLASIAVSSYSGYQERACKAQCEANRYHIEMEERAYFAEHNAAGFIINDLFSCPSGGVYVWLTMDSDDSDYPGIGCSSHYAGFEASAPEESDPPKEKKPKKPKEPKGLKEK